MEQALKISEPSYRLHDRLGYRLSRVAKLVQTRLENRLAEHGITRLKWCVLSGVGLEGIETPSELADHIGITRPATSRLLMQMRKEKLIRLSLDEVDGRSRQVNLTSLGQRKLALCLPLVQENQAYFQGKLNPKQLTAFRSALDAILLGEDTHLDRL